MNESQNRRQRLLKILLFLFIGILFLGFSAIIISDCLEKINPSKKTITAEAHLPLDGIDPKEIWVNQIRNENNLIRSENHQILKENETVQGKIDFIQDLVAKRVQEENEHEEVVKDEIAKLRQSMESLWDEIKNSSVKTPTSHSLKEEIRTTTINRQNDPINPFVLNPIQNAILPLPQEIFVPLGSVACPEPINLHHVDQTIPAGTTVKAILLSSVDMPCGVRGSIDPLPVKLRMIADGKLPHRVRARLKSGIVTACVYGDLSSERVYFRLEKLTQVRPDGHYIETQVAGYVSGEDGKYGLRGTVVDRSSELVENALFSGFLSGVSSFFEAAALAKLNPITTLNGCHEGCQMPSWKQTAGQLAISGGNEGITSALDALTDYFIKRAEQLRPVIQIAPGRVVDVTFSDCADLGDLYTHERVRNSGMKT